MKLFPVIFISKLVFHLIKILKLGAGSTWPGEIALVLDKNIAKKLLKKNKDLKIILIAGTNGKTTTAKLLKKILTNNNYKVFSNKEGANLENGVVSSLLNFSKLNGKINFDIAIFELDENSLVKVFTWINPYAVILLNLFRDQLDRYGELNSIVKNWTDILSKKIKTNPYFFINGQDPELLFLGNQIKEKVYFFGVSEKFLREKQLQHEVDSIFCPKCTSRLLFKKIAYSHLGKFSCPRCGFANGKIYDFENLDLNDFPLAGIFNLYNLNAALLASKIALKIPENLAIKTLKTFKPAFGRGEKLLINGKKTVILLSKNPAGFNRSLELAAKEEKNNLMLLLNDRLPDGKDVSWIWDINFEKSLKSFQKIFVGGDRVFDMALRLKYSFPTPNYNKFEIGRNPANLIKSALNKTAPNQTLFILATYSAMLEARKILTGKKIL